MNTRRVLVACFMSLFLGLLAYGGPFKGERKSMDVNGHVLSYEIGGSGPAIVLLHGGLSNGRASWAKQLDDWSVAHTLVMPDQTGHGYTADESAPLEYGKMADDTAELIRKLDVGAVDLVGWSDGAIVALIVAARHPECVRSVVASGANYIPSSMGADKGAPLLAMKLEDLFDAKSRAEYAQINPGGAAHALPFAGRVRDLWLYGPSKNELSIEILGTIRSKVLIIAGDRDAISLEETLAIHKAVPDSLLWIVPGTGHATFLTRPELLNPVVIQFLDGKWPRVN